MKKQSKKLTYALPIIGKVFHQRDELLAERDLLVSELAKNKTATSSLFPDGHFYSPIPSVDDISRWKKGPTAGVNLNLTGQRQVLKRLKPYFTIPFPAKKNAAYRFHYDNTNFTRGDADVLYAMLRVLKPKRIVEVGSGYSSALMADTNMRYFGGKIKLTCIEPYPALLRSLLFPQDEITILERKVQDVPLSVFSELKSGDILFLDSTHVTKCQSDVNHLLFSVLPRLKKGVFVHIHDIFDAFEYPKDWLNRGFFWNEDYLVHAFLQYNAAFEVYFFSNYLANLPELRTQFPLRKYPMGSLWLRKVK